MERFIYRNATLVLGQSKEIIAHVQQMIPEKKGFLYRNFPDHQIDELSVVDDGNPKIKLFYAGLLGVAQGVLEVCRRMDLAGRNIEFHIFGDGAEKTAIEAYIKKHPEKSIVFHGMLERSELLQRLTSFDIALVPLTTRIYGSVPSKIFEYGALGIPSLYFGGGEGEDIVSENRLGWVAEVGNYESLNATLTEISNTEKSKIRMMRKSVFETSQTQFNLDNQIKNLIAENVF